MNKKYIATCGLSNNSGIGIINIEEGINDYVIFQFIYGDKTSPKYRRKIEFNDEGRGCFKFKNIKYYLDEFIRTNFY